MKRKIEREQAFCLVFEKLFRDESADDILALAEEIRDFELTEYIETTFRGVCEKVEEIDNIISPCLENWTIGRLSKATLALLRLAVFEMKFNDLVPESVTINEVVELAKEYQDEKDAAYINGVLGTISRKAD